MSPPQGNRSRPRRSGPEPDGYHRAPDGCVVWGFLIGLYIAMIIYPFFEEWQQRRIDKGRLAKMRAHQAAGRRCDVAKCQWVDE
jgi:hypothetical protein